MTLPFQFNDDLERAHGNLSGLSATLDKGYARDHRTLEERMNLCKGVEQTYKHG